MTAALLPARPARRRRARVGLSALVALLTATALFATWFLGPAPVAVEISAAVGQLPTGAGTAPGHLAAAPATSAPSVDRSADGTYAVDPRIGTFSVSDTTGTFVGFRLAEVLAGIGQTEAIGRTPAVTGDITIRGGQLTAATFTADLVGMVSDDPRREHHIDEALETTAFPTATFALTSPIDVAGLTTGGTVHVDAAGTLEIHGVVREVTVAMDAVLRDGVIVVTGSTPVVFADYGVAVPRSKHVVSVEDHGTIELQLFLSRAPAAATRGAVAQPVAAKPAGH